MLTIVRGPWPNSTAAFMTVSNVSEQWEQTASAHLPPSEIETIARKIRSEDRRRGIAARVLLALLLDKVEFSRIREGESGFEMLRFMRKTREGRPFFNLIHAPLFSLSHCDDYVACVLLAPRGSTAVSREYAYGGCLQMMALPYCEKNISGIGIDIEKIRPLQAEDYRAAFSREELREIGESTDSSSELIRRWTVKEATTKALGLGFLLDPSHLDTRCGRKLTSDVGTIEIWKTENGTWGDVPPCKDAPEAGRTVIEWQHLPGPEGYWLTAAVAAPL